MAIGDEPKGEGAVPEENLAPDANEPQISPTPDIEIPVPKNEGSAGKDLIETPEMSGLENAEAVPQTNAELGVTQAPETETLKSIAETGKEIEEHYRFRMEKYEKALQRIFHGNETFSTELQTARKVEKDTTQYKDLRFTKLQELAIDLSKRYDDINKERKKALDELEDRIHGENKQEIAEI